MKYLLTYCIMAFALSVNAQDIKMPEADGKILFEFVDSANGVSKDAIYLRARFWFVESFKSADDVIEMEDKESGIISGKGIFNIRSAGLAAASWPCRFMISVITKDNKYKVSFSGFKYGDADHSLESLYEAYKKGKAKKSTGSMLNDVLENISMLRSSLHRKVLSDIKDF